MCLEVPRQGRQCKRVGKSLLTPTAVRISRKYEGENPNGYFNDLPPQAMALGVPLVRTQDSFGEARHRRDIRNSWDLSRRESTPSALAVESPFLNARLPVEPLGYPYPGQETQTC